MVSIGIVQCEPPLNTQYGVPGNYAGSNNNHGTSGGNGLGNHHYDNGNDNDYVDQVRCNCDLKWINLHPL